VDGRANQAAIEFLAEALEIPRASVTIASGEMSRTKVVRIVGVSKQILEQRLEAALASFL
jgi:uncharacterized protein YggU (UPF0235/DUF167 family)